MTYGLVAPGGIKLKIVITNDDGYGEPGLKALFKAVQEFGAVVVVAPRESQSLTGHRVTLREAIRVDQIRAHQYAVHGTPADCARLALKCLAPDADWVISGINPGANLGTDVYQSGTVAAAREAAILGVKALAISQYIGPNRTIDWDATCHQTTRIISVLLQKSLPPYQYLNINLPHPENVWSDISYKFCPMDKHPHDYTYDRHSGTYRYRGIIHDRPRSPGSDVDVCFSGQVSLTHLEI